MRVTIHQPDDQAVIMKIEGHLAGLQVPELRRAWLELAPSLGIKRLRVDLRGMTHIDGMGRNLLAEIHAQTRAEFLADTPLTKYFAEEAARNSQLTDTNSRRRRQS